MANEIDGKSKQLAIMIARVHIMDVIIFQNTLAGIYLKSLVTKRDKRQGEKIVLPPRKDRL